MSRPVSRVAPETPLKEVARILSVERISGVPVVEHGGVVGVVSEADIVRIEQGDPIEQVEPRTAGDAMSAPAVTIGPGRSAADAARLMTEKGVKRLPVVLRGELVGIVSRSDLV